MRAPTICAVLLVLLAGACSSGAPPEVLMLDGGKVTVNNHTDEEWRNVEIWVNNYYRIVVPSIAAKGLFQAPLDSFISGYGQRFDYHRAQITDLRLSASRPSGERLEAKKAFEGALLDEAVGGKR